MGKAIEYFVSMYSKFGGVIFIPIILLLVIGLGGQWLLYDKCKLKGLAVIVPVWNVVEFLKIMGRPAWQSSIVIVPPLIVLALLDYSDNMIAFSVSIVASIIWLLFVIKVYIELCQCFGKTSIIDYILVIVFNGLYVLSLGLSYEAKYKGPLYNLPEEKKLV